MHQNKTEATLIEPFTVRFPKDMLDRLRAFAKANDRSLNAEIVNAVRSRVQAYQDLLDAVEHNRSQHRELESVGAAGAP